MSGTHSSYRGLGKPSDHDECRGQDADDCDQPHRFGPSLQGRPDGAADLLCNQARFTSFLLARRAGPVARPRLVLAADVREAFFVRAARSLRAASWAACRAAEE